VGVYRALKLIDLDRLRRLGVVCREKSALEAYCQRVPHDPHLITIYHVGMIGDLLYYIMDLADDYTTRGPVRDLFPARYRPLTLDIVLRERALGVDVSIEIARRLLMGLSRLHDLNLIHRDVKPSNIVFVDHRPKLADIGIVTTVTKASEKIGTRNYMPPDKVMDMTADTYALGKVLFQMLAGRKSPDFPVPPPNRQWEQSRWSRDLVCRVIARACADTAAERYASATAMLNDLEQCVEMTVESLFDDLEVADVQTPRGTAHEAIELGYAFLRTLPWIFGIIALLLVISLVTA
jgi:serine/threonine protein kinase